jgi:hypothetical protein
VTIPIPWKSTYTFGQYSTCEKAYKIAFGDATAKNIQARRPGFLGLAWNSAAVLAVSTAQGNDTT